MDLHNKRNAMRYPPTPDRLLADAEDPRNPVNLPDYTPDPIICDMIDCDAEVSRAGAMCSDCMAYCEEHA